MSLCSVAGALVNSPTISSRMSSSVTSPWMSPYSSTTSAMRRRSRLKLSSCTSSVVPSGTKYASRSRASCNKCSRSKSPRASARATFFMCRMPTMLSRLPWQTGNRVCGVERSASRIVSQSSLTSTYAISPRGIMMSSTLMVCSPSILSASCARSVAASGSLALIGGARRAGVRRAASAKPAAMPASAATMAIRTQAVAENVNKCAARSGALAPMPAEDGFEHDLRAEVSQPQQCKSAQRPVGRSSPAPAETPAAEQQHREHDPRETRQHCLVYEVLCEQVVDEHEAAEQRQCEHCKARRERLECAGLERFDRRQRCQPAKRFAAAQTLIEQSQRDCQRDGDREQRVRQSREHDMRGDFPARSIHDRG